MGVDGSAATPGVLLVGWRPLCLTDGRLHSWTREHAWVAAPTSALTPAHARRCDRWALFEIGPCVDDARCAGRGRYSSPVIGLVEGRGAVLLHGEEGFNCEHDSVLCIFEDWVWDGAFDAVASRPRRWARWGRRPRSACPPHERSAALRNAASILGIPVISMADAIHYGVLAEFGLRQPLVLATSLEPSRARNRAEHTSPT